MPPQAGTPSHASCVGEHMVLDANPTRLDLSSVHNGEFVGACCGPGPAVGPTAQFQRRKAKGSARDSAALGYMEQFRAEPAPQKRFAPDPPLYRRPKCVAPATAASGGHGGSGKLRGTSVRRWAWMLTRGPVHDGVPSTAGNKGEASIRSNAGRQRGLRRSAAAGNHRAPKSAVPCS